jgi:hypothetical protein
MELNTEARRFLLGANIGRQVMDVAEELNRLSPFIASAVRKADPEHLNPVVQLLTENRSRLVERSASWDAALRLALYILAASLVVYCWSLFAGAM